MVPIKQYHLLQEKILVKLMDQSILHRYSLVMFLKGHFHRDWGSVDNVKMMYLKMLHVQVVVVKKILFRFVVEISRHMEIRAQQLAKMQRFYLQVFVKITPLVDHLYKTLQCKMRLTEDVIYAPIRFNKFVAKMTPHI